MPRLTLSPVPAFWLPQIQLVALFLVSAFAAGASYVDLETPSWWFFALKSGVILLSIIVTMMTVLRLPHDLQRVLRDLWRDYKFLLCFIAIGLVSVVFGAIPQFSLYRWITYAVHITAVLGLVFQMKVLTFRYDPTLMHKAYLRATTAGFLLFLLVPVYVTAVLGWGDGIGQFRQAVAHETSAHPNQMASLYLHACFFMIWQATRTQLWAKKFGFYAAATVFFLLLVLLFARSVWVGGFLAVVIGLVIAGLRQRSVLAGLLFIGLCLGLGLGAGAVASGFTNAEDLLIWASRTGEVEHLYTLTNRTIVWQAIWDNLTLKVLVIGQGFGVIVPNLSVDFETGALFGAHNSLLFILASTGILGLGFILCFLARYYAVLWRTALPSLSLYGLVALSAFLIDNLASDQFAQSVTVPFLHLLLLRSLLLGMPSSSSSQRDVANP